MYSLHPGGEGGPNMAQWMLSPGGTTILGGGGGGDR